MARMAASTAFASPAAVGAGASGVASVNVRNVSQRPQRRRLRVAAFRMAAPAEEESVPLVGKPLEESKSLISNGAAPSEPAPAPASPTPEVQVELSPEERRMAEIREKNEALRAAERFVQVDMGNYVCITCGYLYEPEKGERLCGVEPGTAFEDIDELFACPVCKSPKRKFRLKPKTLAGFAQNQKYGLGANSMTAGQKNLLIFGALAFFILLLLSGYLLD